MKQQSERKNCQFIVEKECVRGPIYNTTSYRIVDLQNRLTFYEGQLDPLQGENETLKDSLLRISHLVSFNTGILRKLLLVEEHPARRLKLEMATFEEITQFIDQHCRDMEREIAQLTGMNSCLEGEREALHKELIDQKDERQKDLRLFQSEKAHLTANYEDKIGGLELKLRAIEEEYQSTKSQLLEQIETHKATIERYTKEMYLQRTEFGFRERQLKTRAERLQSTNQASSLEYEEGRKALKSLYEKMINDRLAEQGETYELMLKHKEEEKHRIYVMIDELKEAEMKLEREREEERQKWGNSLSVQRETIKELQNQLYGLKELMKRKGMEEKQSFRQLVILKENFQILQNNCKKYEASIEKLKQQHQNETTLLQSKINELSNELSDLTQSSQKQKRQLRKELNDKQALISIQQVKLEDIDKTVKLQIRQFKTQSELKEQQLYAALEEKEQRFKDQRGRYENLQKEMERDLQRLKQRHKQAVKKLQKEHNKKRQELIKENQNRLQKLQEQREDEIIRVKLENSQQIQTLKKQFELAKEKIKVEQVQSNKQEMLDFSRERREYKEKIQVLENTIGDLKEEISKLKKGVVATEDKIEKLKAAQVKEIIKLDNKNSELNSKWQAMYDKQMTEFQQSFEEASRDFGDRQAKLHEQIEKLTIQLESHQEEKVELRKELESQVKELKTKAGFDKIEHKMREQMSSKVQFYQGKEKDIKRYYQQRISSTLLGHHNEKQELLLFYNKEIYDLKEKAAQILLGIIKTAFEVEPALAEQHSYDFSLSEEEKGVLIERCFGSLASIIQNKNDQISQMREHLQVFEKSIQAELQERKDQIQEEREKFLQKQAQQHSKALRLLQERTLILQHDYQTKKAQLQKDSKAFSQILYEQFNLLSSTHEKEYRKLFRRYDELQRIHETRPSKAADIMRIKQLQSLVKKLSLEAENSKKKVQYANQIMKYMNMELENYKETYDVFGPTGEPSINSTFSFNSDQKMLKAKRSLLRKMKADYIGNLSKNAKLQVKVTPFFEERKEEQTAAYSFEANLLQHSRMNSDEIVNNKRKYSEENEDEKQSGSLQSKESQRKRSMQRNRRILRTEQKLVGKQVKVLESSQSLLEVLSSKHSKLMNGNDRSLGITRKLSYRNKKIKRLSSEVEHLD